MQTILNYINGTLVASCNNAYLDNVNPATGVVYSRLPDSEADDVNLAVEAAKAAFAGWSNTPKEERSRVLLRIADLIDRDLDKLALAECIDNGKPISLAKAVDIPRASANFRFYGTAILHFASESHDMEDRGINYTLRQPIGVAGCISPWNLPLYLFTWKIAPALAAGNTVVAKPSEVTPMTAFLLCKLCIEAGLPPGVLNVVHGLGAKAGQAIVAHPHIPVLSFTGGTATGRQLAATAAPMFKKLSLELGGKNPTLVFADCDFDRTLKGVLQAAFSNQGQICLCGSRILIERSLYSRFRDAFVEKVQAMTVGDPTLPSTKMGAVVSEAHHQKVLSCIDLAIQEGATVLCGGKSLTLPGELERGYYIAPTVLEGLLQNCRTNTEEIFGPVVTLQAFDSDSEAVELANATPYGLAASVWTKDLERAHRTAQELHCGIVWINCWLVRDLRTPFGGVKASGVGREGGMEALRFFTEPKNVCISLKPGH
jgi:aminomuconate-semialdehyde/2-hydroxymuconate-6-semialdehyde dehydrogenase